MKTHMSSQYPLVDNRPIDQLKVTELKDELKRRRLKTGGLKDELIRRLDEALRAEMDQTNVVGDNDDDGVEEPESENVVTDAPDNVAYQPVVEAGDAGMVVSGNDEETMGNAEEILVDAKEIVGNDDANVVSVEADGKDKGEQLGKDEGIKEQQLGFGNHPVSGEGEVATTDLASGVVVNVVSKEQQLGSGNDPVSMEGIVTTTAEVSVVVGSEVSKEQSGLVDDPVSEEGIVSATDVVSVIMSGEVTEGFQSDKAVGVNGLADGKIGKGNEGSGEEHSEDVTPAHDDVKLVSSVQNNQVSDVSTSLGFPVKSNISVSTDSLSIFEKTDVKDNLIADNVKLESDVTPEMVQPSSSDLVPDGGESHLRDVDKPHENKDSVQETDNSFANADMSQKNYCAKLGSKKLNLDRSSGDDSMEEDASETKQIDINYNSEDLGEKTEKNEVTTIKAESPAATSMDTDVPADTKAVHDQKNDVTALSEKRKLSDEQSVLNKPAKRQHRWKTESNSVTAPQISHIPPASANDVPKSVTPRRSISKSDSFGANDPPKEREVPPPTKPATNSLRIDRFLRPFTLKAVQELLAKTGTVASFWMDHIKTHCYVTYSSVEEAVETRNAVYNLQWPPNGGRQLAAEFVDPEEVKLHLEPPPPVKSAPSKAPEPAKIPQLSVRQRLATQPSTLPPPPPIMNQVPVRGWIPPPPPPIEKQFAPIMTLDDLFRKTKATPRIYYLPLSDEEVAERRIKSKQ